MFYFTSFDWLCMITHNRFNESYALIFWRGCKSFDPLPYNYSSSAVSIVSRMSGHCCNFLVSPRINYFRFYNWDLHIFVLTFFIFITTTIWIITVYVFVINIMTLLWLDNNSTRIHHFDTFRCFDCHCSSSVLGPAFLSLSNSLYALSICISYYSNSAFFFLFFRLRVVTTLVIMIVLVTIIVWCVALLMLRPTICLTLVLCIGLRLDDRNSACPWLCFRLPMRSCTNNLIP